MRSCGGSPWLPRPDTPADRIGFLTAHSSNLGRKETGMSTNLNQPRTSAELIAELESESPNFDAVCIAVAFEENAEVIFANDANHLEKLNAALARAGKAIGLIGIRKEGQVLTLSSRPFREYKGKHWAREFLANLSDVCFQRFSQEFGTKPISQQLH
jgi:hypothetical protein